MAAQIDRGLQLSTFQGFLFEVTELYQLKRHNILVGVGVSVPGDVSGFSYPPFPASQGGYLVVS